MLDLLCPATLDLLCLAETESNAEVLQHICNSLEGHIM